MTTEADLNIQSLVSNIVNENRCSHCRLCLQIVGDNSVGFDDLVSLDSSKGIFTPLSSVLTNLLRDDEIAEEIPGIDAVCNSCVEKALEATIFLEMCRTSNNTLNKVFTKLNERLSVNIDLTDNDQTLYVVTSEQEAKIIVVKNETEDMKKVKDNSKKKSNTFECNKCVQEFDSVIELAVHNMSTHNNMMCEYCNETFSSDVKLEKHIDKYHNTCVCKDCGIKCEGFEKLRSHEQTHMNAKKNECPKCGKVYSTKEFYQKHVKLCLEGRLDPHPIRGEIVKTHFCDICGKGYSSYGGLRVHNRFAHGNAKPHVCEYCGKKFTAPSYLKTHMVHHTGEKKFKCDLCGNRFVSKEALLYHTRRHTGEKPYSCKHCNERFVNASARAEHIKFKHVGPTLMCELCSQKFVTTHFLKQHISRHHDPTSKLYIARTLPPNMPGEENMKIKLEDR